MNQYEYEIIPVNCGRPVVLSFNILTINNHEQANQN